MFIPVSSNLIKLAQIFPKSLYLVGGYVRNCLMDINGGDIDLAADMDIEEVVKFLKGTPYKTKVKNAKLHALTISIAGEEYEFTSFRRDFYANNGKHSPIKVERTHQIIEDMKRRDFTINAIYYDINKDEIIDFYHGVIDAKQKILRCISEPDEVLNSDGERILRLIRLAGELKLKVEKRTFLSAKSMSKNVKDISPAKRFAELEKILYSDKRYSVVDSDINKTLQLLNDIEIWQGFGLEKKKVNFNMVKKTDDRFLGLLIDIINTAKPPCMQAFLEEFLDEAFAFEKSEKEKIITVLSGYFYALKGLNNKEYFFRFFSDMQTIFPLLEKKSKRTAAKYQFFYQYIIGNKVPIKFEDLKITRQEIEQKFPNASSVTIESMLSHLLGRVFDGAILNSHEALLAEAEKFIK